MVGGMTDIHSYITFIKPTGGKTHLLILPETLSVLSLLSFFLNILEGSRRGPTKISHSLLYSLVSVFLALWLPLCLASYCGPSQTHSKTQAHAHVSTVAAPPRQVNRCVTAPTSTSQRRTRSTCSPHSPFLPFLFIGGGLTHSALSVEPFNHEAYLTGDNSFLQGLERTKKTLFIKMAFSGGQNTMLDNSGGKKKQRVHIWLINAASVINASNSRTHVFHDYSVCLPDFRFIIIPVKGFDFKHKFMHKQDMVHNERSLTHKFNHIRAGNNYKNNNKKTLLRRKTIFFKKNKHLEKNKTNFEGLLAVTKLLLLS